MTLRRTDVFGLFLLLALSCLALFPIWSQFDHARIPEKDDDWDNQLLLAEAQREAIHVFGLAPVWNQYPEGGTPLLGNPESTIAYPLTWLTLPLSSQSALKTQIILHFLIGMTGMYFLGRSLQLSPIGAAYSAVVFMGASIFPERMRTGHLMWMGMSWMPWAIRAGLEWSTGARRQVAVLLAAQWLLGAHYIALYTLMALILLRYADLLRSARATRWSLGLLAVMLEVARWTPITWRPILLVVPLIPVILEHPRGTLVEGRRLAVVVVLFALLGAAKLLPTLELWSFSARFSALEQLTPPNDSLWLSVAKWVGILGRDAVELHEDQPTFFHPLPLMLALLGLAFRWRKARPLVFIFVLGWLWSLGDRSFLPISTITESLPALSLLRYTARAAVLVVFSASCLAGLGIRVIEDRLDSLAAGWLPMLARAVLLLGLSFSALWMMNCSRNVYGGVFNGPLPAEKVHTGEFVRVRCKSSMYLAYLENHGCTDGFTAIPMVNARHVVPLGDREYRGEAYLEGSIGRAIIEQRTPRSLLIRVLPERGGGPDGVLVVNQSYYPGWSLDTGKSAESWQGLLATRLEPGRGEYRFVYSTPLPLSGALLALGTILALTIQGMRRMKME